MRALGAIFLLLSLLTPAFAAEYVLFDEKGEAVLDYNTVLDRFASNFKPGDVLNFGQGDRFEIQRILGVDQTSFIVETTHGRALRLANALGDIHFLKHTQIGAQALRRFGVSMVRMDSRHSSQTRFLLVERLIGPGRQEFRARSITTLHAFLSAKFPKTVPDGVELDAGNIDWDPRERKRMMDRLVDFMETTAPFSYVGDFREDQVAWNGNRWVLFDWLANHDLSTSVSDRIQRVFFVDTKFSKVLENRIRERRAYLEKFGGNVIPADLALLGHSDLEVVAKAKERLLWMQPISVDPGSLEKLIRLADRGDSWAIETLGRWELEEDLAKAALWRALINKHHEPVLLHLARAGEKSPKFIQILGEYLDRESVIAADAVLAMTWDKEALPPEIADRLLKPARDPIFQSRLLNAVRSLRFSQPKAFQSAMDRVDQSDAPACIVARIRGLAN